MDALKLHEIVQNATKLARAGADDISIRAYVNTVITHRDDVDICSKCQELLGSRTRCVPGEGNPHAKLMLVGEGPGAIEDQQGRPFVGPAGQLLDKILGAIHWDRTEIYLTNVLKCRPPNNRVPTPSEIDNCRPVLETEIQHVNPKVILCVGGVAANVLIHPDFRITKEQGIWYQNDGRRYMAIFHPAYLLRRTGGDLKRDKLRVWEAVKLVDSYLKEIGET